MIKTILNYATFIILANFLILSMGFAQIVAEGRTGTWGGWWGWQAKVVVNLIQ